MKSTILTIILICFLSPLYAQQRINGKIVSEKKSDPLTFVTIKIKGSEKIIPINSSGEFSFIPIQNPTVLTVTGVGYKIKEISVSSAQIGILEIKMEENVEQLNEVTVVSTGYQTLPKERSTGSFVQIDNELLNRRISTSVLDRLEDITPGLIFNRGKSDQGSIRIRGQNTIYGNANPLIVIDNFPYDGDISNINPNDVESMTVLKDAAAASIWGARAGNGVIVITTKRGKYNQKTTATFNSNLTVSETPDLFYQPRMSSSDFIENEKALFFKGFYTPFETQLSNPALTPVVELLIKKRNNPSLANEIHAQIEALKTQDVRNDFQKYFYQNAVKQQYSLNLNGGSQTHKYYLSAGYDHNVDNLINNGYDRITLNTGNSFSLLNDRLNGSANIYYTQGNTTTKNGGTSLIGLNTGDGGSMFPYAVLADANGEPLAMTNNYRASFVQQAHNAGLLDWGYRPLEEIRIGNNVRKEIDYRINTTLKYKILNSLSVEALYQYNNNNSRNQDLRSLQSYFARDIINKYTQVGTGGTLSSPIPIGSILDVGNIEVNIHSIRGQFNFSENWNDKHEINAIAGYELRDYHTTGSSNRFYGYDENHAITSKVNYLTTYPQYHNRGSSIVIPFNDSSADLTDRYISYYANGAYTYNKKYTLSGSIRFDRSNLFGVEANQQGVPLYSAGLAWNISEENFYGIKNFLPYLKLRATYGYNGNVNKSLSAYTTALYRTGNPINTTFAEIINPPNPELRWERVRIINFGIDFGATENRITGSIEPFFKYGKDLIGDIAYAPSTGISTFRGNTANTKGTGIDLTLNTRNLTGAFKWDTNLIFSHVNDKVVDYDLKVPTTFYVQHAETNMYPMTGRPFYSLYSYKWAGLDPLTGDPQGFLNGAVSKNYTGILAEATPDNLVYHGSARPTVFGAIRNTFSYKQFSISANISYRLNYFYRKRGLSYNSILTGQGYLQGNYSKRWQNPGDELQTIYPSLATGINANRDSFFNFSEANIEKGDHIRFQDINFGYNLSKEKLPALPFNYIQFNIYANNIGLIWKASNTDIDPDYPNANFVVPRSLSIGLKAGF
jgi:TonB-linked SusC/RagA family outer membrane protein